MELQLYRAAAMSRRALALAAGIFFAVAAGFAMPSAVLAQAGATGGGIGKQGKSVSGGEEASPLPSVAFTVTSGGQLTGHWFIKPKRVR